MSLYKFAANVGVVASSLPLYLGDLGSSAGLSIKAVQAHALHGCS